MVPHMPSITSDSLEEAVPHCEVCLVRLDPVEGKSGPYWQCAQCGYRSL